MSDGASDTPAAPDISLRQTTSDAPEASVQGSHEAAQASESPPSPNEIPTEQDVWDFVFQRSKLLGKQYTAVQSEDFTQYMVSPNGAPGPTAKLQGSVSDNTRSSFVSFGDQGTTASVNSHGQLMQITKFLDVGRSGFLCADSWDTPEPYFVQERADSLMQMSTRKWSSISFYLHNPFSIQQLDFICDRWPRFTGAQDRYFFQVQYYACHGSIFQQYVFEERMESKTSDPLDSPETPESPKSSVSLDSGSLLTMMFTMDSDILIRDLDWQDDAYSFNDVDFDHETYETHLENDHFSLVRTHTGLYPGPPTDASASNHGNGHESRDCSPVELVVTAFLNGRPQRLKQMGEKSSIFSIDFSSDLASAELSDRRRLEVTVVYKLQLAQRKGTDAWKSQLVAASDLIHMRNGISANGFQNIQFSKSLHLDFAVRRNLEHILSVCCVPVPAGAVVDRGSQAGILPKDEAIALTCGDMSGHRVANSASFFAFEFLVAMHAFLKNELKYQKKCNKCVQDLSTQETSTTNPDVSQLNSTCEHRNAYYVQVRNLASRIHTICKGHMNWVFKVFQANSTDNQPFGPNYWASGRRIQSMENQRPRYLSQESVTDTAFQLIKAEKFYSMSTPASAKRDLPQQLIRQMTVAWTAQLNKAEKRPERGPYAFARLTDDVTGNDNYYLEDHVWIWKALKSIETIDLGTIQDSNVQERKKKETAPTSSKTTEISPRRYSSNEAQRHILKRFTTENPASKRRMLAVFRSSSESRFMLRSRDTALFHCMESKFFNMAESTSLVDVWKSTLVAQISHEENQTAGWETPLRYALALLMATKKWQINRASRYEIFDEAKTVLLGSSWTNGLFPGLLNPATKDPEIFQDGEYRDNYWHVTFEVPYVIWMYTKQELEQGLEDYDHKNIDKRILAQMDSYPQETNTTREVVVTKKNMPFNDLIDQTSIVEPSDEWLYNEPDFLTFTPGLYGPDLLSEDNTVWSLINHFETKLIDEQISGPLESDIQRLFDQIQSISRKIHSSKDSPFRNLLKIIQCVCMTHWHSISQQELTETDALDRLLQVLFDIHTTTKQSMHLWVSENLTKDVTELVDQLHRVASNPNLEYSVCLAISRIKFLRRVTPLPTEDSLQAALPPEKIVKGAIIDVKRSKSGDGKKEGPSEFLDDVHMLTNEDILRKLNTRQPWVNEQQSTPHEIVKKRLIWLPCADIETAMTCCLSTPTSERENMFSFFERHATYDKFFFDDTTAALNTWNTEIHFAFYQLHEHIGDLEREVIPKSRRILFPIDDSKDSKNTHEISRATMGFRFNGDFFDRYWTCHFVEYKPKMGKKMFDVDTSELFDMIQPQKHLPKSEREKQPWRQRKVLELILFDKILEVTTISTEEIMDKIRQDLKRIRENSNNTSNQSSKEVNGKNYSDEKLPTGFSKRTIVESSLTTEAGETLSKTDALEDAIHAADFVSKMKGEAYLQFSKQSQAFEQVLRVLDDDLGENLEQIERWKRRDDDRAPEKPRWTRNDERRYRTTITKMLALNDRRIRALHQCRSNVQSLRTSLESTREYIRDDLNLRGAEDIRLFTYVTATFLPISFATSVFSMGEFPGGALLGSMIGLAVVALLLTGIALVHDKTLASGARVFKRLVGGYRSSSKQTPSNSSSLPNDNKSGVAGDDPKKDEGRARTATSSSFLRKFRDKARGHSDIEEGIRKRRSD